MYLARKNNVQSQQQKHQEKMSIGFKNNIKSIRLTSANYYLFAGGNCPEPFLGQFFLEYIPIKNQTFAIKSLLSVLISNLTARNFNNSRPINAILREMRNHYRSLPKYLIHENSEQQHLFISEKAAPKTDKLLKRFTLYSKARNFSIISWTS